MENINFFEDEMAIVAIIKNEGPYIKEWLDYHITAGVTKFYLYDNESEDNLKSVLQPYIDNANVEYVYFPGKCMQLNAYNDALEKHRFDCRYMAFIDADEFIYPKDGGNIPETIHTIISKVPEASGIVINWRIFGSSGQEKKNLSIGVLKRFQFRAEDDFNVNNHIKTIVNPRRVKVVQVHYAEYFKGCFAINENGEPMASSPFNKRNTVERICINHYFTKSREEFKEKRTRGKANRLDIRPLEEFDSHDKNDVHDDGILKYLDLCKSRKQKKIDRKKQICDALDGMVEEICKGLSSDLNIEMLLCYCYMYNKYSESYIIRYDKKYIYHLLVETLEKKIALGLSEWELRLLICSKNIIKDICREYNIYRGIMQLALLGLCDKYDKNTILKKTSHLRTFHNTIVCISATGDLLHHEIGDENDSLLPVYALPVAEDKYVFFFIYYGVVVYISEFQNGEDVIFSILPRVFQVNCNGNQTISIQENNKFLSAVNNGTFRFQVHNLAWEQFFLDNVTLTDDVEYNIRIGKFGQLEWNDSKYKSKVNVLVQKNEKDNVENIVRGKQISDTKAFVKVNTVTVMDCVNFFEGGAENIYLLDEAERYSSRAAVRERSRISPNGHGGWSLKFEEINSIVFDKPINKENLDDLMIKGEQFFAGQHLRELPIVDRHGNLRAVVKDEPVYCNVLTDWQLLEKWPEKLPQGKLYVSSIHSPLLKSFYEAWQGRLDIELLSNQNYQDVFAGNHGILIYENDIFPAIRKMSIWELGWHFENCRRELL